MIVRPHLIFAKNQTVYNLKPLVFPDFETSFDFAQYVMNEWKAPPEMLEGFTIPPDCEVKYRISTILRDPEGDWAYMLLSITNAHLVSIRQFEDLKEPHKAIVKMMRQGLNDKQMSARLRRSRRWVQYRIAELKEYYHVKTRLQLEVKIAEHSVLRRS